MKKTETSTLSKKERFTPGPWYIKPRKVIRRQRYGDAYTRTTILDTPKGQYKRRHVIATVALGNGRGEANAALIAAAPEMYEALKEIVAMEAGEYETEVECAHPTMMECYTCSEMQDIAREALEKVRGGK